ncbi:hypothetical protein D1007_36066 [Hordeum vulgare]|nr:hypothetical protein D1007_36066 [Hordeum vulgare]
MEPLRTSLKPGSCDDGRRKMMEDYAAGHADHLEFLARELEMRKLLPTAASAAALLATPRVGDTRETSCHVCQDDFEEEDKLRAMPCAHTFHQRCIFRVLSVNRLCPVCGYQLPADDEMP